MIELEKLRAKVGYVDLDRTLRRARFAGETALHRVVDLVREVWLAPRCREALPKAREEGDAAILAQHPRRLDAALGQQPQPLAHQRRAPLRRVDAVECDLRRR